MQKNALICTKAMGVHNAILRAAVSTHAGHVIEQEGDSWSVAFHRPVEAVAFCLQVIVQDVNILYQ
jgi:class 3 adenylate cyclase